jgi:nickel/cobalt transporter (NiCoT) family protein
VAEKMPVRSGPLAWVASVNLENFGFMICGLFAMTWLCAVAYWKLGKIEARYSLPD